MVTTLHAQRGRSAAFTLVELLIVILIIMVLFGLLLAGAGALWRKTDAFVTKTRMSDLERQVLEADSTDGRIIDILQEAAFGGDRPQWDSLRAVVTLLTGKHGLDITQPTQTEQYLPPNLSSLYDNNIGCYTGGTVNNKWHKYHSMNVDPRDGLWQDSDRKQTITGITLDRILVWRELTHFGQKTPFIDKDGPYKGTPPYSLGKSQSYFWWKRDMDDLKPYTKSSTERWAWLHRHKSMIGESLDETLELVPDEKRDHAWYRETWPILKEERFDGEPEDRYSGTFIQHAWPDSDWNQAQPGTTRPIWEMPWGKTVILRATGTPHPSQYLRREKDGDLRSLDDLCPLDNVRILAAAGVLPEIEDLDRYRNNRNREATFNDRWGNPLILASALYIAPRYYLDPSGLRRNSFYDVPTADTSKASHGKVHECHNDLLGPRDLLIKRAKEIYGYSQAAYLAVAAMGEFRGVYGDDNAVESAISDWTTAEALSWTEADDDLVHRAIWLQATEICEASDWTDVHMAEGLWDDIAHEDDGDCQAFLSAPFHLRR